MVRFISFVIFFASWFQTWSMEAPFWSAICAFSFCFMFVGLKPFTKEEKHNAEEEVSISRDRSYLTTVILALLVFGGTSYDMYHSNVYDVPEALNPPETLRIGDTKYFERAFSLEEITDAKKYVELGTPVIGTRIDYSQFLWFFLTLSILYILLISFNAHWNNSKTFSLGMLAATLAILNYYSTGFNELESEGKYPNLMAEATQIKLYPIAMDHCRSSYQDEESSSLTRENVSDSYIVDSSVGSSVVTITSDNKELKYQPGSKLASNVTADHIKLGICPFAGKTNSDKNSACDDVLVCVSAVNFTKQNNGTEYRKLSYQEATNILNEEY